MTTTDTDALTERIGRILNDEGWTFEGIHEPGEYDECEECRLAVDPIAARVAREVAVEVRKAKAEALTKRWVCQVARSGYHNGASCRPDEAHNDWGCDYYYEASIRAAEYETGDSDEHR